VQELHLLVVDNVLPHALALARLQPRLESKHFRFQTRNVRQLLQALFVLLLLLLLLLLNLLPKLVVLPLHLTHCTPDLVLRLQPQLLQMRVELHAPLRHLRLPPQ